MFDVEKLAVIDADLAGAQQGDRDAQLRLMNFHIPWLLVFARTVNDRIEQGFYADAPESEEDLTPEVVEDEGTEDTPEDVEEGSEDSADAPEDAPETEEVEEEHVKVREGDPVSSSEPHLEADQDDSIGEDSVAEPGSPTALAEEAAIVEANEAVLKPHQVLVPHDYVMETELYEAAGGVFFEPGFTPEGGYTAPWLMNEADEVVSETENNGEEE